MTVAERWFYFPIIGIFGMIATIFTKMKVKKESGKLFLTFILGAILILLTGRTIIRNQNWKNGLTLYTNDIQLNPEAFDLQNNYGVELFRSGKKDEAKIHFENSIALAPNWTTNYSNLGVIYERLGDEEEAEKLYKKTLENGDYYLAVENLASLYFRQKKYSEVITFCEEQIKYRPYNLKLNYTLAISLYQTGKITEGLKYIRITYQLYPDTQVKNILTIMEQGKELKLE